MSEVIKLLSKEEAIKLVGGKRDYIHCFLNPNGMLIGTDWSWNEFDELLNETEKIMEAGEQAKRMKHPLAVFKNKWHFFEAISE